MTTEKASDTIALEDLRTVEALAAEFPEFLTVNTLRWYLRHRSENGLATACITRGNRRIYISKSRFEQWLATQTDDVRRAAA
jgi:predicted transcriptional regulator